ncbi:hypothetical protein AB0B15_14390 [Streptomyces sp. NPDC045456]|uniref:hypothetical protein n=1 Tax=Streptomyces sp. NPDC045456 TaxID=3155254 RepID=UPI0033FB39E6
MADEENTTDRAEETSETDADASTDTHTGERLKQAEGQTVPPEVERALRKANKEAETLRLKLKAFEDRDKSEAQKLAERAQTAEAAAETASRKLLRFEVAARKKLPPSWAGRLQGSTREELEADADALVKELAEQQRRNGPSFDGGVRKPAPKTNDMNAVIRRAAGLG